MTENAKYCPGIKSPKDEGSFTIFLREKFWLQSRRIIHADGTPWTPKKDLSSIDLTTNGEVSAVDDSSIDPSAKTEADTADAPPKKKVKRENEQWKKIKDCIDLTY